MAALRSAKPYESSAAHLRGVAHDLALVGRALVRVDVADLAVLEAAGPHIRLRALLPPRREAVVEVASFSKTVPTSSSTTPFHRTRAAALAFFERRVTFSLVISTFRFSSKQLVWVSREYLSDAQVFPLTESTSLQRRFAMRFSLHGPLPDITSKNSCQSMSECS